MRQNNVKRSLNDGEIQIGTWITTFRNPQIVQILSTAGFDFIYIDMEHSSFSIETVGDLCFASLGVGLVPIVRPPSKAPHHLSRPLDAGAMGLLIPHVDTREEAESVIAAVQYPPAGDRGLSLRGVHTGFVKVNGNAYVKAAQEETMVIVQIESLEGIRNLEAILSVEGIDGAVIGRGDLSNDLGLPGDINHPEVHKCVESMIAACQKFSKIPGLLVQDTASAIEWIQKGIRLVPFSNEVNILIDATSKAINDIREVADSLHRVT